MNEELNNSKRFEDGSDYMEIYNKDIDSFPVGFHITGKPISKEEAREAAEIEREQVEILLNSIDPKVWKQIKTKRRTSLLDLIKKLNHVEMPTLQQ